MATFYADSAGSQGTGDGSSAANVATLKECIENDAGLHTALVAGSTIWVKNGTTITFDGSAGVFATTAVAGTITAPIKVRTYTTSTGDGGVTTINDTNSGATNNCLELTNSYWHFEGFKLTNIRRGFRVTTANGFIYRNIEIDNAVSNAFDESTATSEPSIYENCYAHDGAGAGFVSIRRNPRFINCVSANNSGIGFQVGNAAYGAFLSGCIAYKNGADGFDVDGEFVAINCVSYGNTSDGWYAGTSDSPSMMVNCGSAGNGGYGILGAANSAVYAINCALNPTNETNTSGKSNTVTLDEVGEVTGDPLFTNTTPATAGDLSLGSGSAWKAAGIGLGGDGWTSTVTYTDLGPAQREEPAGGSGGIAKLAGHGGGLVG